MSRKKGNPAQLIRDAFEEQLARVREALADRNLAKVAEATGLHENTVRSIAKGRGDLPTIATIEKLGDYLFN